MTGGLRLRYLNEAHALYSKLLPDEAGRVEPCTLEEIRDLQERLGVMLPDAYLEFLLWMGKGSGGFWQSGNAFYPELLQTNEWARTLIEENEGAEAWPSTGFAFHWNVSEIFYFFLCDEGSDPTVRAYVEPTMAATLASMVNPEKLSEAEAFLASYLDKSQQGQFAIHSESFSQCLLKELKQYARIMLKRQNRSGGHD
jgi:hypothetical protein